MPVSITAIAEKIGLSRQKLAAANDRRLKLFEEIDANDSKVAKVMAKYRESGGEPSEEDAKILADSEAAIVAGRKQILELNNEIAKEDTILAGLEEERASREMHNRTEERLNASAGRNFGSDGGSLTGAAGTSSSVRVLPPTAEQMDGDIACFLRCLVMAGQNVRDIPRIATEQFRNDRVSAAMQANTFSAGGALVPQQYMPRLIEGLFATAVVRSMGIETIPIEFGSLDMPRITTGAVANYVGEGQDADETTVGTDRVRLVPKQLIGLLPMSNTLIATSSPSADRVMFSQLSIGLSLAEDRSFLRGVASGAGPTGLRYLAASANVIAANGTVNLANVTADLGKCELALLGSNIVMLRPYWLMAPRSLIYLTDLRDGNGNLAFPTLSNPVPTLRGKPVKTTTTIPINLGGGGNASEVMLVEASQQLIGENPQISLMASSEAAYLNASATMVSAFSRNETVLRAVMYNDINTQHPESIAVLTGVTWGA